MMGGDDDDDVIFLLIIEWSFRVGLDHEDNSI